MATGAGVPERMTRSLSLSRREVTCRCLTPSRLRRACGITTGSGGVGFLLAAPRVSRSQGPFAGLARRPLGCGERGDRGGRGGGGPRLVVQRVLMLGRHVKLALGSAQRYKRNIPARASEECGLCIDPSQALRVGFTEATRP